MMERKVLEPRGIKSMLSVFQRVERTVQGLPHQKVERRA